MKNRLQYAYSISVFIGVLFASYFMMNREGSVRAPIPIYQAGDETFRREAGLDPAVNNLFDFQEAISEHQHHLSKEKESRKENSLR